MKNEYMVYYTAPETAKREGEAENTLFVASAYGTNWDEARADFADNMKRYGVDDAKISRIEFYKKVR